MATELDWLDRVDWVRRSPEFGALRLLPEESPYGSFVAMEFAPPGHDEVAVTDRLWEIWRSLPLHPFILEPVRVDRGILMLRYAAIDWSRGPLDIDQPAMEKAVATWGIEITRAFEFLLVCVPAGELAWIACPLATVDIEGNVRLAFASPGGSVQMMNRLAPEVAATWPACDEAALVFAVGQLLLGLVNLTGRASKTALGTVIERCLASRPHKRYPTLEDLRNELVAVGGRRNRRRSFDGDAIWSEVEAAIGYFAYGRHIEAVARIADTVERHPDSAIASGYARSIEKATGIPLAADRKLSVARQRAHSHSLAKTIWHGVDPVPPEPIRHLAWAEAELRGRELERERRFADALDIYRAVRVDEHPAMVYRAMARCHLEVGELGHAIDYARRAQQHSPSDEQALEIESKGWLQKKQFREALEVAGRWLATAPDSARAHHAAGKALFGLRRLADARDELERASSLEPRLLSAMLLRREVDRLSKHVRGVVGAANQQTLDLPEHLVQLREVLIAGRTSDAIKMLRLPEYESDVEAQLLLGQLLAYEGRHEDALAAYERITGEHAGAALVGGGTALLALRRFAEALERFDRAVAAMPDRADAHEGRAQALLALGRGDEADAAFKQALAVGAQRSDARVRLAGR